MSQAALIPLPSAPVRLPHDGPDSCLHGWFEAQAARTPRATAVTFEAGALTWAELNGRANRLAHFLRARGVGPGALVGVGVERSPEMVIALLGVLKAGAAYVPLDPAYPAERLAFMLQDTQAAVLLTQARLRGLLPPHLATVALDSDWPEIEAHSADNFICGATPDDIAYVIYTSGSTGTPKGVPIAHRSVCNNLRWRQETFPLTAADRLLQTYSFSFDPSVWAFFWPLVTGARVVLPSQDGHGDTGRLVEMIAGERISVLGFAPSLLSALLDEPGIERCRSLRHVFSGGEALSGALVRRFHSLLPTADLHNVYGPTEATIDATWWTCRRDGEGDIVPIGHPLPHTQAYLRGEDGSPCADGAAGELCLSGVNVSPGYWNRPELTTEKFVADPFLPGRMYRTGDLCRYRADGVLEYLGRLDHQVKVRGFRIELGEVEAALLALPHVKDAAVLAREDRPGDIRLAAYVVSGEGATDTELAHRLGASLPAHMIPADWVFLTSLPLTVNGKVDRKALPAPDTAGKRRQAQTPPTTDTERRLAAIWADVLGVHDIGLEDHFFDLGGHSLLAARVASRVRAAFGIDLAVRALFEMPTLVKLADHVEYNLHMERKQADDGLTRASCTGPLPASFSQQRLWFFEQWQPGTAVYNIPLGLRLTGALDAPAVGASLTEIVRRHEPLRTVFEERNGQPFQKILPPITVPLPVVDAESEDSAQRLAISEAQRPFDLTRDPMLRARLVRLGGDEHWLLLTVHHIAADGWSVELLLEEFAEFYGDFAAGRSVIRPAPTAQYADWAAWQRETLTDTVQNAQMDFWRQALADAPAALDLPTDRPRPGRQTFAGARLPLALPAAMAQGLRALARAESATLFMALAAGLDATLARWSGQDDITLGTPVASRSRVETEGLIGFFVNTLALRTDLSGDPTGRQILSRVREAALGAFANADLPFEQIVDALHPQRDPSRHPLFQTLFALQNAPRSGGQWGGLGVETLDIDNGTAKFDLTLNLWEDAEGGLSGWWEYNTALFDAATVERLGGNLATLLAGLADTPDVPLSRLPLLTDCERHQLLVEWNQTQVDYPLDATVGGMFEAQAARTPDALAAVFGEQSLTYAQLNARANQLAHFLRARGVGPETLVGLCLERSPEMVVALLGVLKAGGAYVPLDPAYPPERLAFMLEDTACPLLLTQGHLAQTLPPSQADVVRLDADWPHIKAYSDTNPAPLAGPENLAYVIYTSGSTGRPKGAMLEHRGVCNYLHFCLDTYGLEAGGGSLVHSSFAFDLTVTSLIAPLVAGRAVHLLPSGNEIEALVEAVRAGHDWTLLKLTPAHLSLLAQQLDPGEAAGRARALVVGGENLTGEHVEFWLRHAPNTAIFNEYGPTETVVGCCVHQTTADQPLAAAVPIGRPIANTRLYVLDAARQPVPVGVSGELYTAGAQVGRGYLNRPDLTAEKFVPDPFGPGRMYRTGDLCRYRADGVLEYLGRLDHQVKVRGFRIELGEVEAALLALPHVKDAAVLAREDRPGDMRLAAYLVLEPEHAPDVSELRTALAQTLPGYMLPGRFTVLPSLPLTANGKVDRKALLALPADAAPEATGGEDRPASVTQAFVLKLWQELLPGAHFGVHDDFFEAGGHSLLAVQMIQRLEQRTGQRVPLAALFADATVAHLASVLDDADTGNADVPPPFVAFHPGGAQAPFFFMHGDFGGGFFCADLARNLGPDQPLYTLPPHGMGGAAVPKTIEAMGAEYGALIRQVQPHGPYRLGGFCNGGLIAFETAQQFLAQGEQVELLLLMDVDLPVARLKIGLHGLAKRAGRRLGLSDRAQRRGSVGLQKASVPLCLTLKKVRGGAERITRRLLRKTGPDWAVLIPEAYRRAPAVYTFRAYPGRITLLQAEEGRQRALKYELAGWQEMAHSVNRHTVLGNHWTCLTDHNASLAARIRATLEQSGAD